jgi:hypothetical protein
VIKPLKSPGPSSRGSSPRSLRSTHAPCPPSHHLHPLASAALSLIGCAR